MKIGFPAAVATAALLKTAGVSAQDAGGRRLGNSASFGDVKPTPAPSANPTATPTIKFLIDDAYADYWGCVGECCEQFESRCDLEQGGLIESQYCDQICRLEQFYSSAPTSTPETIDDSANPGQETSGSSNFEPSKVAGLIAAGAAVVGAAAALQP